MQIGLGLGLNLGVSSNFNAQAMISADNIVMVSATGQFLFSAKFS